MVAFAVCLLVGGYSLGVSQGDLSTLRGALSNIAVTLRPVNSVPTFLCSTEGVSVYSRLVPRGAEDSTKGSTPLCLRPSFLGPIVPTVTPDFYPWSSFSAYYASVPEILREAFVFSAFYTTALGDDVFYISFYYVLGVSCFGIVYCWVVSCYVDSCFDLLPSVVSNKDDTLTADFESSSSVSRLFEFT